MKKKRPLPETTTEYHEQLIKETRAPGTSVSAATLGMTLLWLADDWQAAVNADLAVHGISENKLGMLILLRLARDRFNTDITPSELAELVGVERASVTGILDWLENRNFIARTPDATDRRKFTIRLTAKSQGLFEKMLKTYWKSCASLVGELSPAEQQTLSKLAIRLLAGAKDRSRSNRTKTRTNE
ncbi:MAG: MarR family transcriptional regulator [Leptospirales bacterium]|nr:MarR family transcriptional regulator [Leptospirales bacterium]